MAVPSHRRISRKTLRQPDEFISTVDRISDWISGNLARVIVGAVVLASATAIILLASLYSQHRQRVVSEQFYRAINALSEKDYRTAEKGFTNLARNDRRYRLGRLAEFYLGTTYLAQNQPSKARDSIRNYLAEDGQRLFRQLALVQFGVANENLGNYRDAHAAYLRAVQLNGPEKARAQIGVARTLERAGNRKGAIAAYQEFLRTNPFAQQRTQVVEALAQMGVAAEPNQSETSSSAGRAKRTGGR